MTCVPWVRVEILAFPQADPIKTEDPDERLDTQLFIREDSYRLLSIENAYGTLFEVLKTLGQLGV